jgi:Protein of unknown function (DUF2505)
VKFSFDASVAVPPARAVAAYGVPEFYEGRPVRDDIAMLGVVRHEDAGDRVRIDVHYAFAGSVSTAVRAVIDPTKLSWVTRTVIFPGELRSSWEVVPDHYPGRLTSAGSHRFAPADGGSVTVVSVDGELRVHVPIVGRSVERVIVSDLRAYVADEVATIPDLPPPPSGP